MALKLLKKIGVYIFVLIGLSILVFLIARVIPGDPARQALGPHASEETVQALRERMNLDKPLPVQYMLWLKDAVQLDLGESLLTRRPVIEDIRNYLPATLEIVLLSALCMVAGGILLGVLSAKYTGKWLDGIIRVLSYLGIVSPAFVWGVLFMLLFGYLIPILPTTGRIGQSVAAPAVITGMYTVDFLLAGNVAGWWDAFRHLILPSISAFTMGLGVLVATVPIGSILGLIAGYWRGRWFSTLIMRITDVFLALPPIILALCVCAVLRPTLLNSLLAMCFAWWPWYTRLTYSMATSLRNEMYIKSAELLGASKVHILFREILPNCTGSILTKATLDMGWVILKIGRASCRERVYVLV